MSGIQRWVPAICCPLLFSASLAADPPRPASGVDVPCCTDARISFDISSIEHIFQQPEDVLTNADRFWQDDRAYRLARQWHERNKIPVPLDEWRESVEHIARMPVARRAEDPILALARSLRDSHDDFLLHALPLVCSYLPESNLLLDTTVYLTAYTRARSFMMDDNIVINVAHPYWHGDRQHLLNAIVHELFHIGYGRNPTSQRMAHDGADRFYGVLRQLQNEGMATELASNAVARYPAVAEADYRLLANPADVATLRRKLNLLFEQAPALSADELRQRAWDLGVTERAFYVVGADMARTIEVKAGRPRLAETITAGPRSFVATYNALVPGRDRIVELP